MDKLNKLIWFSDLVKSVEIGMLACVIQHHALVCGLDFGNAQIKQIDMIVPM
jgi:hypothetical protein